MRHTEEDWERLPELEKMYLLEKEKEMIEEWMEWEEENKDRAPAKITVNKTKKKDESDIKI